MLSDEVDGDILDLDRIFQRAQVFVQRDQEPPLGRHGKGVGILFRFSHTDRNGRDGTLDL